MDLTAKRNAFARFTQLKENAFAVNRKYFEREVPPPFSEGGKTLIHEKQLSLRNAKEAFQKGYPVHICLPMQSCRNCPPPVSP